jgi:hypothetical protein
MTMNRDHFPSPLLVFYKMVFLTTGINRHSKIANRFVAKTAVGSHRSSVNRKAVFNLIVSLHTAEIRKKAFGFQRPLIATIFLT